MEIQLPSERNSKLYFSQLDSIRGLSFIAIFLFHSYHIKESVTQIGKLLNYLHDRLPLGLETFFILSSFLLTFLAYNEYKKRGNYSFKNYFVRRILRIWPLYYFILALAFVIFPLVAGYVNFSMQLPDYRYYIFFVSNFYSKEHVYFLMFLWTISVEEQFYLLWGLSLKFFFKRIIIVIFLLCLTSVLFSLYTIIYEVPGYFNTLTYLFDFGCGALAAIVTFKNSKISKWFNSLSNKETILFYCYLPVHFLVFYILNDNTSGLINNCLELLSRYFFIIYIALLLIEQVSNKNRSKLFQNSKFLIFTGKISYGLYCYHGITLTAMTVLLKRFSVDLPSLVFVVVCFIINYGIAALSYFYFEQPILKLKAKWRRI